MTNKHREEGNPSAAEATLRYVRCPGCGGSSLYAESNIARPFCSERCKSMDFGAWASESFRVGATPPAEDMDINGNRLQ